jgi:hypothetical protein
MPSLLVTTVRFFGTVDKFAAGAGYRQSEDYGRAFDGAVFFVFHSDGRVVSGTLAQPIDHSLSLNDYQANLFGHSLCAQRRSKSAGQQAFRNSHGWLHYRSAIAACVCNLFSEWGRQTACMRRHSCRRMVLLGGTRADRSVGPARRSVCATVGGVPLSTGAARRSTCPKVFDDFPLFAKWAAESPQSGRICVVPNVQTKLLVWVSDYDSMCINGPCDGDGAGSSRAGPDEEPGCPG